MGFAEALSDDGSLTGRGHPWVRGLICGAMTALGGIGHTLPFLLRDFRMALWAAAGVVIAELGVITWIRQRYMDTPVVFGRPASRAGRSAGVHYRLADWEFIAGHRPQLGYPVRLRVSGCKSNLGVAQPAGRIKISARSRQRTARPGRGALERLALLRKISCRPSIADRQCPCTFPALRLRGIDGIRGEDADECWQEQTRSQRIRPVNHTRSVHVFLSEHMIAQRRKRCCRAIILL